MKYAFTSVALLCISGLNFSFYESIQYSGFELQVDIHWMFFYNLFLTLILQLAPTAQLKLFIMSLS